MKRAYHFGDLFVAVFVGVLVEVLGHPNDVAGDLIVAGREVEAVVVVEFFGRVAEGPEGEVVVSAFVVLFGGVQLVAVLGPVGAQGFVPLDEAVVVAVGVVVDGSVAAVDFFDLLPVRPGLVVRGVGGALGLVVGPEVGLVVLDGFELVGEPAAHDEVVPAVRVDAADFADERARVVVVERELRGEAVDLHVLGVDVDPALVVEAGDLAHGRAAQELVLVDEELGGPGQRHVHEMGDLSDDGLHLEHFALGERQPTPSAFFFGSVSCFLTRTSSSSSSMPSKVGNLTVSIMTYSQSSSSPLSMCWKGTEWTGRSSLRLIQKFLLLKTWSTERYG